MAEKIEAPHRLVVLFLDTGEKLEILSAEQVAALPAGHKNMLLEALMPLLFNISQQNQYNNGLFGEGKKLMSMHLNINYAGDDGGPEFVVLYPQISNQWQFLGALAITQLPMDTLFAIWYSCAGAIRGFEAANALGLENGTPPPEPDKTWFEGNGGKCRPYLPGYDPVL